MIKIPKKEIDYIERINSTFIGQKIEEVFYEVIDYGTNIKYWNFSESIHSIDMNIIFKLENGKLIQIKWDHEFDCYGIGFEQITGLETKDSFETINVTENTNWKSKIGKPISAIDIFWDELESQEYYNILKNMIPKGKSKKNKVPFTWALKIQDENLYVSTFEIKENGENYYWADHLTVFFTTQSLEKYNLNKV